jgi:hypothetical protein
MEIDRPAPTAGEAPVRLSWPPASTAAVGAARLLDRAEGKDGPAGADPTASSSEAPATPGRADAAFGEPKMGKVFVEAFDRLADRVLDRLRSLRQDVDSDLAAVRAEMAALRQAVDEAVDRVQMRQLRASLEEVRADLTGLRRAVLEWPELEQVTADVAAMRSDLTFLFESLGAEGLGSAPSSLLSDLQSVVADLAESSAGGGEPLQLATLGPLLEEVTSLRSEMTEIRRRLTLAAAPLDDEQLEWIVSSVADRVVDQLDAGKRSKRR